MNKLFSFIPIIFIFLSVLGCENYDCHEDLIIKAEKLVELRPDSSLLLLDRINSESLNNEEIRAHYSLLKTMAMCNDSIKLTDDSLIKIAEAYYFKSDDNLRRYQVSYYYALIKLNSGNEVEAAVYLDRADEEASLLADNYLMGKCCQLLARVHENNYNSHEAAYYALLAEYYFLKGDNEDKYWEAKLDKAKSLYGAMSSDLANATSDSIVDWAKKNNNINILKDALRISGLSKFELEEYEESNKKLLELNSLDSSYLSGTDLGVIASNYYMAGKYSKAKEYYDKARVKDSLAFIPIEVLSDFGDKERTIKGLNNIVETQQLMLSKIYRQKVSEVIGERQYEKNEMLENELFKEKRMIWGIVVGIIILIVIVFFFFFIKMRNRKLREKIILEEYKWMKGQLYFHNEESRKLTEMIKELMHERYKDILELMQIYFEGNEKSERLLSQRLKEFTKDLRDENSYTIQNMKMRINECNDGILDKFERDFPGMKSIDRLFFIFSIYNFSGNVISWIFDITPTAVHTRKSRLKKRIIDSDSDMKEKYLSFM